VILADPPWRYEFSPTATRRIENQYPTMDMDELLALPVPEKSAPDAVLFLWATVAKLEQALTVLRGWGFAYKTNLVWDKGQIGMGFYCRGEHRTGGFTASGSRTRHHAFTHDGPRP
jgi:N6-adenosine-specific RNA methylase IME4